MSHQVIQSEDATSENCLQSYQYVWMSHWTQTRLRSVDHGHNQSSDSCGSGRNSHINKVDASLAGPDREPHSSKFVKEQIEINKVLMTGSSTRSCKTLRPDTAKNKHFPVFKSSQYTERHLSLKNGESSSHQERISNLKLGLSLCGASLGPTDISLPSILERISTKPEIQSAESLLLPEGITSFPEQQAKSEKFLGGSRVDVSSHVKDDLLGSSSAGVLLEFNNTRTPAESFSPKQDYINQSSSSFLIREGKMGTNAALSIHDPENSCHRDFLGQQFKNMTNYELCPVRPTRLCDGSSELPKNTSSINGKETMRLCTTVDSGGPSKFSQTTHHIFIKEDTGVNLSSRVQILRESISTDFNRKPSKLLTFSPGFGFNLKQGEKLQPLDSSTKSEGKEKIENVYAAADFKNESSAETDTMDMDTLQENHIPDVAPSIANKDIHEAQKSSTSELPLNLLNEKNKGRSTNIVLPDINQELPPISSAASSTDGGDTSSSRTQSMDASDFLFNAEHPTNLKSSVCANDSLESDPFSRWVKRLKPSSSDSVARGTKSSKMVEASSHEKVKKFFSRMLYDGKSRSEPNMTKSSGEEHVVIDQDAELQRNVESASIELVRAGQKKALSHVWIQRWCHNPFSSLQKRNTTAACEPPSSNAIQHSFHKKQYPSVAAMALMGKAMSGFRPCELRKEGSFITWNT